MVSVLIGFLLLAAGLWLYVQVAPQWAQINSFLGQLAVAFDPKFNAEVTRIQRLYFASFISMVGGGLLILIGLVRQLASGKK